MHKKWFLNTSIARRATVSLAHKFTGFYRLIYIDNKNRSFITQKVDGKRNVCYLKNRSIILTTFDKFRLNILIKFY